MLSKSHRKIRYQLFKKYPFECSFLFLNYFYGKFTDYINFTFFKNDNLKA